ncbi:MAG: ABC transporter permease [Chloroflexi bacterium]|nr:ABC transporter permease [Chloroflexota bacterium]
MPLWWFILQQVRGVGPLAGAVGLAIFFAIAFLAATPLYLGALEDLGRRHAVETEPLPHIQVYVPFTAVDRKGFDRTLATVDQAVDRFVAEFVVQRESYVRLPHFFSVRAGRPMEGAADLALLQHLSGMDPHVRLVEGRFPLPGEQEMEVLAGSAIARGFGIERDARLHLFRESATGMVEVDVTVVGLVEPIDLTDEFWIGAATDYFYPSPVDTVQPVPLFFSERDMIDRIGTASPGVLGQVWRALYVERSKVHAWGLAEAGEAVTRMGASLAGSLPQARVFTRLEPLAQEYGTKLFFTRIPLVVLIVITEALVLYVLLMVTAAVKERQEGHLALLQSRGAGRVQAALVMALWGVALCALGFSLSPLVSAVAVALAGYVPAFVSIMGPGPLPVVSLPTAYLWAAAGALLALSVFLLPILLGPETGIAVRRWGTAQPERAPWFQRQYLDLGALLLVAALLWQLQQRRDLVFTQGDIWNALGPSFSVDQTALLIPVLGLLVTVILLFRLLPILLAVLAFLGRRFGMLWMDLGFTRMARAPLPSNRLVGLLLVAIALATFAATLGGTLDRSSKERALYSVGADLRIVRDEGFEFQDLGQARQLYRDVSGVEAASAAYRDIVRTGPSDESPEAHLLAVDPETLGDVLWFREDFASQGLGSLLLSLTVSEPVRPLIQLPARTEAVGVWVNPDEPEVNRFLWIVVRDGRGTVRPFTLGPLNFSGWRYLETGLPRPNALDALAEPVTLESFQVYEPVSGAAGSAGALRLDDLQAWLPDGSPFLLDGFEDVEGLAPILTSPRPTDSVSLAQDDVHGGEGALLFTFGRGTLAGVRGMLFERNPGPLPVLASPTFLRATRLKVGEVGVVSVAGRFVSIRVVNRVEHFPTMDPLLGGFIVTNGEALLARVNPVASGGQLWPTEVFVSVPEEPEARKAALKTLRQYRAYPAVILDGEAYLERVQQDPLLSAGWRALTGMTLVVAVVLVVTGYAAHGASFLLARRREGALLRALGLPPWRSLLQLGMEHFIVVIVGIGAGLAVGLWLSNALVPLLQRTEEGRLVLPPFVLVTEWSMVTVVAGGIALGALGTTLVLWRLSGLRGAFQLLQAEDE